jgi:protocadherin-16/23
VEEDEDEEIRMINATPQQKQGLRMPDSGMQDDDAISEHSVQNHQEYLARLGIDTGKINTKVGTAKPAPVASSVESMHYFSDAVGGEDALEGYPNGRAPVPRQQLQGFSYGEAEQSNVGSLSSVINSEEEFSGSYNWDYLLDWGPQYQPLADVFTEIARLKDESIKPKTKPTQIVPQRQFAQPNPSAHMGRPPPILTDMPPRAVPLSSRGGDTAPSHMSSSSSVANSARTSQLTSISLPKSPISYESSFTSPAMSPSFTPSLSPLGTRSPSISPLTTPKGVPSSGHSSSGGDTPKRRPQHRHRAIRLAPASSDSEREIQI